MPTMFGGTQPLGLKCPRHWRHSQADTLPAYHVLLKYASISSRVAVRRLTDFMVKECLVGSSFLSCVKVFVRSMRRLAPKPLVVRCFLLYERPMLDSSSTRTVVRPCLAPPTGACVATAAMSFANGGISTRKGQVCV